MDNLSFKEQILLIKEKCPDIWEHIFCDGTCPSKFGLEDIGCFNDTEADGYDCGECWEASVSNEE